MILLSIALVLNGTADVLRTFRIHELEKRVERIEINIETFSIWEDME